MQTIHTIETKQGTMNFKLSERADGFKGCVTHNLHKHPTLKGKTLTRFSNKTYKTKRGATNWLKKEYDNQFIYR